MRPIPGAARSVTRAAVAAGLLLMLALGSSVTAAQPSTIQIKIDFDVPPGGPEAFTTGGALNPVCPSGYALTDFGGNPGGWRASSFHLDKTLYCQGGATLTIRIDVGSNSLHGVNHGGWSVIGGTGALEGAVGGGKIVAHYIEGPGAIDLIDDYTGQVIW